VVICLERGADLHTAQLMPLPLTVSCFSKIQIGFAFLVPAHSGSPGQRAVKRVCLCVCVCVCVVGLPWCIVRCAGGSSRGRTQAAATGQMTVFCRRRRLRPQPTTAARSHSSPQQSTVNNKTIVDSRFRPLCAVS